MSCIIIILLSTFEFSVYIVVYIARTKHRYCFGAHNSECYARWICNAINLS